MKTFLKIFLVFLILIFLIYANFFYLDPANNCSIRFKPSLTELSTGNIKRGLKVLKIAMPDEYKKVCHYVKVVDPNLACGGFQGGCYYGAGINPKEISVSTANQDMLGWTAAVIVHETCHAIQFQENRPMSEEECYLAGNTVLEKIVEL